MPYIKPHNREFFDKITDELFRILKITDFSAGEINYVISRLLWKIFESKKCYSTANALVGVLECIKLEFYRRKILKYEDIKKKENGDIVL